MSYIKHFFANRITKNTQKKSEKKGAIAPKKEGKGKEKKGSRESPGQAKTPGAAPVARGEPEARSPAQPPRPVAPRAAPQHTRALNGVIGIQHRPMGSGIILAVLRSYPLKNIASQVMNHFAVRLNRQPPIGCTPRKTTHCTGAPNARFAAITTPAFPLITPRVFLTFRSSCLGC